MHLAWTPVAGVTTYDVHRRTANGPYLRLYGLGAEAARETPWMVRSVVSPITM